jgi:hypothetical protein
MNKKLFPLLVLGFAITIFLNANSCTPSASLRTVSANPAEMSGTYTVFLYGARHSNDIETVAILAKEETPYTFEIYSPDFNYKTIKGMPADQAYKRAAAFVSFHYAFDYSVISRILDKNGAVIGYEVRPYYKPFEFGYYNVFDVSYTPQDSKVIVSIHLIPAVEKYLRDGDRRGPFLFRMR